MLRNEMPRKNKQAKGKSPQNDFYEDQGFRKKRPMKDPKYKKRFLLEELDDEDWELPDDTVSESEE